MKEWLIKRDSLSTYNTISKEFDTGDENSSDVDCCDSVGCLLAIDLK